MKLPGLVIFFLSVLACSVAAHAKDQKESPANSNATAGAPRPRPLDALHSGYPAKEYIYIGDRLLAIEDAPFSNTNFAPSYFYTVTPCRVLDTRNPNGPLGGPALIANQSRTFTIAGQCGIPADAKAVSMNVTVTGGTAAGSLTAYATSPVPGTSTISYTTGQTRANNAIMMLGAGGTLAIWCGQPAGTTTHFLLDVNGYFK